MKLNPRVLSSAAAIAITCVVSAAAFYYKSRNKEVNEVMVFCKLQFNAYNSFDKLVSFIEDAKYTVNVCMPGINNPVIQARLVSLLKTKKIKVQIIIDRSGYNESTEFFLKELIEAGAEIKCKPKEPVFTMQHKFCLVDDKILMTGTLNWGNDRSFDHWNYVYITSKQQLVDPVKREFYQLWEQARDVQSVFDIYCDSDAETFEIRSSEESETEVQDVSKDVNTLPIENKTSEKCNNFTIDNPSLEV
ncbi:unnamed protein product [Danaus chrysippus]|uniref:Mitochondrial cardiolipin hydrolase n=1 Tax=Danaus chrysippus TaxID=151541 RepID=A0A8J2QHT1_9NEOP|nr:unnamed protein product [Danaus chrysippus]